MPSSGPSPQTYEDGVIHAMKNALTHYMPVIVSPAPYFGVEPINQIGGRNAQRGFDCLPDAAQEGFNVLLGRLDEQFPVGILAHILSEKIEALLHVRDDRLPGRKFQPSFEQKLSRFISAFNNSPIEIKEGGARPARTSLIQTDFAQSRVC